MVQNGLQEVSNPSLMMLTGRPSGVSGTCVACVMEGSRPILAEVQALVSKTGFGTPRRMSTGFDNNRTALLLAVLEKRGGYFFGNLDTYINVVGGLRLDELPPICRSQLLWLRTCSIKRFQMILPLLVRLDLQGKSGRSVIFSSGSMKRTDLALPPALSPDNVLNRSTPAKCGI